MLISNDLYILQKIYNIKICIFETIQFLFKFIVENNNNNKNQNRYIYNISNYNYIVDLLL